jgi:tetratricopeptide (TPR) repeat protein
MGSPGSRVHGPRRLVGGLPVAVALTVVTAAGVRADLADDGWIEVASPHFTLVSQISEERTRELAEDLERFRRVVLFVTRAGRSELPVPTRVIVFDRPWEWEQLGEDRDAPAAIRFSVRESTILLLAHQRSVDRELVQRGYVQVLLRNQSRIRYPLWYEVGMAEVLAATTEFRGEIAIGQRPTRVWPELLADTMSVRRVIDPRGIEDWDDRERELFDAEAWALTHYLLLGDEYDDDTLARRLADCLAAQESGTAPVPAFEEAFDVPLSTLALRARRYHARPRLTRATLPASRFESDDDVRVRALAKSEVGLLLGDAQLRGGELDGARSTLERAVAQAPGGARARARLASVLAMQKRFGEAVAAAERALALGPDDPIVQLDAADVLLMRARARSDPAVRAEDIRRARAHIARARVLDPAAAEPYLGEGYAALAAGDDPRTAIASLETAHRILPADLSIRLILAEAYLAAARDDEAEAEARSVLAWSRQGGWTERFARDLLALIDAIRRREAREAAAPSPPPAKGL